MANSIAKPILYGALAGAILLGIYFAVLTLVSGWSFTESQFATYWYFIVSLAAGFGIQISLYSYLRELVYPVRLSAISNGVTNSSMVMKDKTVAVTGMTSTLVMISCCAHYLANIVPILGIAGALTIIVEYQTEIFWVGLALNTFGIAFIGNKIIKFKKHHA